MKYSITKKEDRHFFAGLFNTAVDNLDLSLTELKKRVSKKTAKTFVSESGKGADIIIDVFNIEKYSLHDLERNYKILNDSLRFMDVLRNKYFESKDEENRMINKEFYSFVKDYLLKIYKTTVALRNYYTHFEHDIIEIDEFFFDFLKSVLFYNAKKVKNDRLKNDSVRNHIKNKYSEELDDYVKSHKEEQAKKNRQRKEAGEDTIKIAEIKEKEKINFVLNRIIKNFLYFEKENGKIVDVSLRNYLTCSDEEGGLSKNGLVLLLATLLDRKQINVLFDNFDYVEKKLVLQKQITRWVYTHSSYKSIRYLFKSNFDREALLLQMANELNKAPKNLYPLLSDKDKDDFVEDINIYLKDNATSYNDQTLVAHEVIRRRYEEKFTYFAIRFLDEMINFPNLRFQVNVGKFNHNTMEKKYMSSNLITERSVLEKINVFEKLSIVTNKKKKYIAETENKDAEGWLEFPSPKYVFFGNSIAIWLPDGQLGKPDTSEKRKEGKPNKIELANKLGLKEQYRAPVAYISIYELPSLLYALLIKKQSPKEIEKILKNQINKQRQTMSDIENVGSLHKKLKLKIKKLSTENIDWDKIEENIREEMLFDPLQDIRKNYRRKPKFPNSFSNTEKGKIASWLSKDIKKFTKKNKREDWKGHQFAEFQSLLSFYDFDRYSVENFLKQDFHIDIDSDLLFKGLNFDKTTLYDFYMHYLSKKEAYLNKLIIKIMKGKNISDEVFTFLPKKVFGKQKSVKEFYKQKIHKPFMLPRGLFDNKPTYSKSKDEKLADWFTASSDMKKVQEFYHYTRYYTINYHKKGGKTEEETERIITINTNKGLKEQYVFFEKEEKGGFVKEEKGGFVKKIIDKKYQKIIFNNEKQLRRNMRNDYYILQMIKHYYADSTEIDKESLAKITLKDFYLTKAEKKARAETKVEEVVFNESFILKKQVPLSFYNGKIRGNAKLKEAGKYKRMILDSKVARIHSYYPDKEWTIEQIVKELDKYEEIRSKVFFKEVHNVEKIIYEEALNNNKTEKLLDKNNPNFTKYLAYYYLNDNKVQYDDFTKIEVSKTCFKNIPDEFKKLFVLTMIRNKFAHSQLVEKDIYNYLNHISPINEDEYIADYLSRMFKTLSTPKA